jgi:hypothetical protein
MDIKKALIRKKELFQPIHRQILMTDDRNDLLLLASNMCETSINIFLHQYGLEDTKRLLEDILYNINNSME